MTEDNKNKDETEDFELPQEYSDSIEAYLDSALEQGDDEQVDDLAIQKRLTELEAELKIEEENKTASSETPEEALQTEVAQQSEDYSHAEIEEKLEEAKPSGIDYDQRQANQPSELDGISADDLALEDNDEESEVEKCLNCSVQLEGSYCHNCGQPNRHFIRFFPKVLWDMINEAFDFDSRIFRTLMPLLFMPGRLSMEYIAGRRARYVNPLRLYIFLSVIFFISISLFTDTGDGIQVNPTSGVNSRSRTVDDAAIEEIENPKSADDSKPRGLDRTDGEFDIKLENGKLWNVKTNPITFAGVFSEETTNELNIFLMNLVEKLDHAIKNDTSVLVEEFLNAIPQLMFILLPLFALLLKITYVFKKRYYMEHLIVALHSHCFIFFSLLLIILFNALSEWLVEHIWLIDTLNWLVIILAIWIPLNIYITQKKIYAQGYVLTTMKFIFIGVSYWALLTFTAAMAFVVGLVNL